MAKANQKTKESVYWKLKQIKKGIKYE